MVHGRPDRENNFFICLYRKNIYEIFLSRTARPEKLKFTLKLSYILQKQVYKNHNPVGSGGTTIGGTVFTYVYIGKIFSKSFSEPLRQSKFVKAMAPGDWVGPQ
jgi:hypothetical protein